MVRLPVVLVPAVLFAAVGCVSSRPVQVGKLNDTLKEALPSATAPPTVAAKAAVSPVAALTAPLKTPPATQFVTVWQTKLSQLPDPTKSGAMNPGIVGQVFLYTDKFMPADIGGSLTIVANDATDRPPGQPAAQPNVWHFDVDTLKRMTVMDERFGKCLAVFLPWPEEWKDVNRLLIQARFDQPGTYPLFAPQSTVTLDFFTSGAQVNVSQTRSANALAVPDPKLLMQQAAAIRTVAKSVPPLTTPIQQAGFQQPAVQQPLQQPPMPQQSSRPAAVQPAVPNGFAMPAMTGGPPAGQEFRSTIPRN